MLASQRDDMLTELSSFTVSCALNILKSSLQLTQPICKSLIFVDRTVKTVDELSTLISLKSNVL